MRVAGTGDVRALASLLRGVTSDERLLAIRELSVSQSDPTAASKVESLRLDLTVEALCLIEPARAR